MTYSFAHIERGLRLICQETLANKLSQRWTQSTSLLRLNQFSILTKSRSASTSVFRALKTQSTPHSFSSRFVPNLLRVSSSLETPRTWFSTSRHHCAWFWKGMGDMQSQQVPGMSDTTSVPRPGKVKMTEAEWKAKLTPQEYSVLRNHGTERAFTGDLLNNKGQGVYTCTGCGTQLFSSSTKFDSGSGWPSFYDVLKDRDEASLPAVDIKVDSSHGMTRTEVLCGKCDAHLGHVFNDGPAPTGNRYCINSVCLKFKPGEGAGSSGGVKSDL